MPRIYKDNIYSNLEISDNLRAHSIHAVELHVTTLTADHIIKPDTLGDNAPYMVSDARGFREDSEMGTSEIITSLIGEDNHRDDETSLIMGGKFNHISGTNSLCIGGEGNEIQGNNSLILSGQDNQVFGDNSAVFGTNCIAVHDNTFIFNGSDENVAKSSAPSQCVLGADNGTMFKLPLSSMIKTNMIDEGFACMCWDPLSKTICVKTKQENILYKTNLPTMVHEIKVEIKGGNTHLINPDDY